MEDPWDIQYNPQNKRMYIVSFDSVKVVETSNTNILVVDTISNPAPTQSGIQGIAYNPKKKLIYIIHTGQVFPPASNIFADTVSVFRASDNTKVDTIALDANRNAVDLVYNPHKKQMYLLHRSISASDTDTILVIRTSDNTIVDRITLLGQGCTDIIYNPQKKQLYVSDIGDNTVSVIRTSDNTVIRTIPAGRQPEKIAYNPHKKRIYVTNQAEGTITVIRTSNNTIIKTIPVAVRPFDIAYNPHKREMYVTHPSTNLGVVGFVSVVSKNDL